MMTNLRLKWRRAACMRVAAVVLAAAVCAAQAPEVAAAGEAEINLVPHRAKYELRLKTATAKSGITQAHGRLVFEMDGDDCIGYTANTRILTRLITSGGTVNTIDTWQTAWEGPDSTLMRFGSKEYLNSNLSAEVSGHAQKGDGSGNGVATFETPEGSFDLPPAVAFPVEHTKRLLVAARAGRMINRTVVFNGTETDKVYTAVSFIGKPKDREKVGLPEDMAGNPVFDGQRAWPVTVVFYDNTGTEEKGEQEPSHEISFTMFENGIAADMLMNYGFAAVEASLSELTLFEPSECDR